MATVTCTATAFIDASTVYLYSSVLKITFKDLLFCEQRESNP